VSDPEQRRQTRLVGAVLLVIVVCFLALGLVHPLLPQDGTPVVWVELTGTVLFTLGFAVLPLAVAVAVLRQGLWGAPPVLRRALALAVVSAVAFVLYAAIVIGLAAALGRNGEAVGPAIAAAVVALLVEPLRHRATSWATRLGLGDRDDAGRAVLRLARSAGETLEPRETVPALLRAVRQAIRSPGAALVDSGVDATDGVLPPAGCWESTLVHQGHEVGVLRVAPRSAADGFDSRDRRLLADVARSTALAVHAVRQHVDLQRLAEDLQTSRARLVTAREEERRRLRRDLHDRLGPSLAGQVLRLETARELVARDPAGSAALLDRAIAESEDSLREVKRVVDGLRPPALDDAGLEQALRLRVGDLSGRVVVRPPTHPLPELPAAVEVAAFHIASEAISNSLQHAPGAMCWTGFTTDRDHLLVTVEDDGPGIKANGHVPRGHGLSTMSERAAELGGSVRLARRPGGGTVVTVALPLTDLRREPT
jgi:signal transduction histidine kinase